jgi:hypothetical protein
METHSIAPAVQTYQARLRGGPDDGALVRISALPGGAPPDFLDARPEDPGLYVLAGAPHADGSLPYWFMSSLQAAQEQAATDGPTWTLVSIPEGREAPRVWHQHREGEPPVRLRAEPAASARVPSFVGRVYSCPECEETTVISLPER